MARRTSVSSDDLIAGMSPAEWNAMDPTFSGRILDDIERDGKFVRRMSWACLVCAFVAFLVITAVATVSMWKGYASQAGLIFSSGSFSIIALFATSRFVYRRRR